jgi:hypothetical protein
MVSSATTSGTISIASGKVLTIGSNGVSTSRSVRIYKTYGESAIETVRANPYALAKCSALNRSGSVGLDGEEENRGSRVVEPRRKRLEGP